ncbi:hypothetical protein LSTR_LSTR007556 [Laodelphax striatellus]|uniref:Neurotransmitter-gated ion-channel ligand-binding domain-containing protein n=1 Tax=Laodelphax striatellus TaxID=195883 RepID=A0A482XSE3_LAOST|nr:hypothetical protein LSTR_LSTR007556 [Laodelphax striatellus]
MEIWPIFFNLLMILSYSSKISGLLTNDEKNRLLRDYDKYQSPPSTNTSGNTDTMVKFRLLHLFLSLDSEEEALSLTGVFHYVWTDSRLAWNKLFSVSLDNIWSGVPNIAYKAGSKLLDLGSGEKERNTAIVLNRGVVVGATVVRFRAIKACRSDLTDWPYDTKTCNVYFISSAIKGVQYETVNLIVSDGQNQLDCNGWNIENLDFHSENNGTQILLSFDMKRDDGKLANYFYLPAIVSLVVSMSLFFLKPQSSERFILLLLITIIQFYLLKSLSLLVPQKYNQRPTIELFVEMSTILILIQIFLVIICRALILNEYNPPFLSKTVSLIVMSRVLKTIFLLEVEPKDANELIEDQEDEDGSFLIATKKQTKKQWQLICRVIHQATFYFTGLLSLYLIFIVI